MGKIMQDEDSDLTQILSLNSDIHLTSAKQQAYFRMSGHDPVLVFFLQEQER